MGVLMGVPFNIYNNKSLYINCMFYKWCSGPRTIELFGLVRERPETLIATSFKGFFMPVSFRVSALTSVKNR